MQITVSTQVADRINKFARNLGLEGPPTYGIYPNAQDICLSGQMAYGDQPTSDENAIARAALAILDRALTDGRSGFVPVCLSLFAPTFVLCKNWIVSTDPMTISDNLTNLIFAVVFGLLFGGIASIAWKFHLSKSKRLQIERAMMAFCADNADIREEYVRILKHKRLSMDQNISGFTARIDALEAMANT